MAHSRFNRRQFGKLAGSATFAYAFLPSVLSVSKVDPKIAGQIKLGFDNFSIRGCNWKAEAVLDFAIEQKVDSVLFSDLDVFENHNDGYLAGLKAKAADNGITIQAGTGGICPTSGKFIKKWGSAQDHMRLCIRVAQAVGSRVVRCYLGHQKDRQGDGGIKKHIDSTVETLKSVRNEAIDAGIKFAVENHAGDMQAWELVTLIEAAGTDFVGATLDSGNATWTLEDPITNLEVLGPYALSSGIRDSTVWEVKEGAKVAWNAVGEGQVDWKHYVARWLELCPNTPFQLEIISGFNKGFAYNEDKFWEAFPKAKAKDFRAFQKMAKSGKAIPTGKAGDPEFQKAELVRSIAYCKNELGLGQKK